MSGAQTAVEFNFIVNISSDELDELDPSRIEDVTFNNTKDLKINLKNRLSRIVLESVGSMGGIHLKEESFSPSNKRLTSTHRSIHFGDSPGKTTGLQDDYLIRFRLSVVSFVDHRPRMQVDDIEIWDKIADTLNETMIYLDKVGDITGTIHIDDLSGHSWDARETSMGGDKHHPQTSEIDKSRDASFEKTMNSDSVGGPFNFDSPDDSPSDIDRENPLGDYDAIEATSEVQDTYDEYEEDSIQVRKPTESEIEEITSAIYQQIEKMTESDEPVYLEEVPDNWKNATCSRCSKDTDSVLLKFSEENKRVIRERLETDFGLGTENDFVDSRVTNFYVTEEGRLLVRPEEIISWVISIVNETRPYCDLCNATVGGDQKHTDFRELQVKSTNDKRDEFNELDDASVDEYVNQRTPKLDYERIQLDTDDTNQNVWNKYRSPTQSETKDIERSIVQHLWRLGTRSSSENQETNAVYNTLFKRDYDQEFSRYGNYECDVCGSPVSDREKQDQTLQGFERHHIEPIASNRVPVVIQKIQDLIHESKNADSKSSPIKISKDTSRFLFTDEFLSLLETLYRNVDTIALFCGQCDKDVEEEHNILSDSTEGEKENSEEEVKISLEHSFGTGSERFVKFLCPICKRRRSSNDSVHSATFVSGKYMLENDSGKNELVPIIGNTIISEDLPIGLCIKHKNNVSRRLEEFDIDGSTHEEKLRDLLTQLAYPS